MGAVVVRHDYRVIAALNMEWEGLKDDHRDVVQDWSTREAVLAGCSNLEDVLALIAADADAVLFALLSRSRDGDYLAARVVLQALLGKVVLLARRDPDASEHDYVVALWGRIATYPLATRPVKIAANLALDALKTVSQERRRSTGGSAVTLLPELHVLDRLHGAAPEPWPARTGNDDWTAAGVIETADQLGLLDVVTRDVLLSVYAEGLSGGAAAERHQTTPGMVRFRCSRAVRRLAAHSAALVAA